MTKARHDFAGNIVSGASGLAEPRPVSFTSEEVRRRKWMGLEGPVSTPLHPIRK